MKAYVYLITLTKGNNVENIYGTYTDTKESFQNEFLTFKYVSDLLEKGFSVYLTDCALIDPKISSINFESETGNEQDYTQQIYYTITARKRKSNLKDWLFWLLWIPEDIVEENVFTAQDIVLTISKFQYAGYDKIEITQKYGDREY